MNTTSIKHLLIDMGYNLSHMPNPGTDQNKCWLFRRNIWVFMAHALLYSKFCDLVENGPPPTDPTALWGRGCITLFGLN